MEYFFLLAVLILCNLFIPYCFCYFLLQFIPLYVMLGLSSTLDFAYFQSYLFSWLARGVTSKW